tara:strand:+ start:3396 stop:4196 length:801 start_codon:yes stop_codon:yes gene_type:complete
MRNLFFVGLIGLSPLVSSAPALAGHHEEVKADAISAAVAAPTREEKNKARDIYRHPIETLQFFGVKPDQTVVEFIPGGGWYTQILAPLVRDHGRYIGLQPTQKSVDSLKAMMAAQPAPYDKAQVLLWPASDAIAPGSVDSVLTFRNIHNMVMNDKAPETFAAFFAMLKPGGTLGIVDHRLPESADSSAELKSGYLKVSTVRKLAEDAGFVLEAASEINANPKDAADWDKGVWTLPPTLTNGAVDREKYLEIGESDRMTLRFRKPAA